MLYLSGGGDEKDSILIDTAFANEFPIIALPERSGIVVDDQKMTVIGFEPVLIFDKGQKLSVMPGENYSV